jgi:hypothetical protein
MLATSDKTIAMVSRSIEEDVGAEYPDPDSSGVLLSASAACNEVASFTRSP